MFGGGFPYSNRLQKKRKTSDPDLFQPLTSGGPHCLARKIPPGNDLRCGVVSPWAASSFMAEAFRSVCGPRTKWLWVKTQIVAPVNPNPTTEKKIYSNMGFVNSPIPKWDPKTVLNHGQVSCSPEHSHPFAFVGCR